LHNKSTTNLINSAITVDGYVINCGPGTMLRRCTRGQEAALSTSFVDFAVVKFSKSRVWDEVPEESQVKSSSL